MNRIFGFFKQKIKEVKQQNKQQIQNIINAFQYEPYSNVQMLSNLQEIKTNYLQWTIMIANEASTGLYFTQLHNKTTCLKKVKSLRQNQERRNKNEISLEQMQKTLKQLKQIEKLSYSWAYSINQKAENISVLLAEERKDKKERQKILKQKINENEEIKQQFTIQSTNQNNERKGEDVTAQILPVLQEQLKKENQQQQIPKSILIEQLQSKD